VIQRDPAEINRGLEPARTARPIPAGERIHVVGAGGAAGAAALLLAVKVGAAGSGCDRGGPSQYTPPLVAEGIPLAWEHAPAHVASATSALVDRLAVTKALTAIAPDHPELLAARAHGIPATSVQQLIADAAATRGARLLGVAGTHGKSTTTGWVIHLLAGAGLDPSGFVGALLSPALAGGELPSPIRLGEGSLFVVEADEYAGNFDPYRPAIGVLLNADWDHPDVFRSLDEVIEAFEGWIRAFDGGGKPPVLVANASDPGVAALLPRLADWSGRLVVTALIAGGADPASERARIEHLFASALGPAIGLVGRPVPGAGEGTRLEIAGLGEAPVEDASVRLPGRHNASDGLAAAGAALVAGAPVPAIVEGLASFGGVGRRFELKGEIGGVAVIDDYGHHPTAIAATLEAVAARYPGRRVWAVYEPLTYHRTAALLEHFAEVLEQADRVVIARIHAGRDPDTTITSADALAAAVERRGRAPAWAPGSVEETADWLADRVTPGDVVLVMGGGRSYVIADRLVAHLRARTHS